MSEEYEATQVVREYADQGEALADQLALREAGIDAVLSGDVPSAASFHIVAGRLNYAPIQLAVPVSRLAEALAILDKADPPLEEGWEAVAEGAIDGWLCPNCDSEMPTQEPACLECGTLRSDRPPEDDEE